MNKGFSTKLLSVILAVVMIVSIVPIGFVTANAKSPGRRLTAPKREGWYADYTRNNCGKYAQCRINEIVGRGIISRTGPSTIASELRKAGYSSGKVPKEGAVAVSGGHVAIVELIENGRVYMSEGHYAFPYTSDYNTTNLGNSYQNTVRIGPGNKPQWGSASGGSGYGTWFTLRRYDNYSSYTFYYLLGNAGFSGTESGGGGGTGGGSTTPTPTNNTHYDATKKFPTGTYKNTCNAGVNMRSSVGVQSGNKVGCTVPNGAEIYVSSTNGNWGYTSYAGRNGWVCLDYFTFKPIPIPGTPGTPNVSASDIAKGKSVTISWSGVSGASGYKLAIRGAETKDLDVGNRTSYTYTLSSASSYNFHVAAYNVSGTSSWSGYRTATAHNPVTVQFVDWDDTALTQPMQITWGESAKAPDSPSRKGYTFQGWSDSYFNVKEHKTIKATYKINTYIVNFYDREGVLIDSQRVTYGSDATPPTDTHETGTFLFQGWNSTDYLNVYTDRIDKNINIDGIYSWYNYDLPAACTIKSAERQFSGYNVTVDIENNDNKPTTGRIVAALKTAEGKLIDMTESTAFSIKAGGTKSGVEVFLPCNGTASQVEVFMVANYSTGVPISPSVSSEITKGQMFAESVTPPDNDGSLNVQEITQYRYRDKEKTTGNAKTKDGWIWDGSKSSKEVSRTGYQDSQLSTYDNENGKRVLINTRDVAVYGTRTKYEYYHYRNYNKGSQHVLCPVDHGGASYHYFQTYSPLACNGSSTCNGSPRYGNAVCPYGCTNKQINNECWWQKAWSESYQTGTKKQYDYATYDYIYGFYRWKPWSEWSDTPVTETDTRDVDDPRIIYRYETKNEIPEDNSGTERVCEGNLGSQYAGKQVTLYVYGYTGASDYTNEFIGQTTVESDGHYSFTYKLREEPTIKTGDFTVAIGVEGMSDIKVVDTIAAPKPQYTVNFYDWDGTIISAQTVTKGENAIAPQNPTKEGFKFLGWDKSVTNIIEDTDIYADFEREEYTVVFVDWENRTLEMKKFSYGDVLTPPEAEDIEGYNFIGWDAIENGTQYVTEDMVVTAQYEKKEYQVKFYDFNNNVIDTQFVKHDETAFVPDDPSAANTYFAGWFNPEDYQYVKNDANIYPSYYFEETTAEPVASHESGEYTQKFNLTLTSSDHNAVIYYYLNDDREEEAIYTGPISIDKSCSVTWYAQSLGKNSSETQTNYYCINSDGKPTDWMLYSQLPSEVIDNPADYTVESETGYSYKDVERTSSPDRIEELSDAGWTLAGITYTNYTEWQNEPITDDGTKIGFEVDNAYVEDDEGSVYRYSHYKYTDSNGSVQYSPTEVANSEYEVVYSNTKYKTVDFLDGGVSVYAQSVGDSVKWFSQTRMSVKYRSRYKIAEYYKWTDWIVPAIAFDDREKKTNTVYRYYSKNYHLLTLVEFVNDIEIDTLIKLVQSDKSFDASVLTLEGHSLYSLYSDLDCTQVFNTSEKINESMTLYAKFIPNEYKVTFQMQDGTKLKTQMVPYMESATAPETDSVPGWVFAGWDKDFSEISEETVVTGRYIRESEYAYISLPRSTYNMYTSTNISLTPTITPVTLADEKVEWTTSNASVATVDDKGNVTAVGAGEAEITVKVISSGETAKCKVIVKADLATTITLKSNSSLNYDDLGFLRRIKYRTAVSAVGTEFENTELKFYKVDGTELSATDFVGTGSQIRLFDGDNVIDSKTVVVTGDLNGDGIINNRDVGVMNRVVAELITLEDYQNMAFDANGDGAVNNKDVALIARFLVGKEAL